MRCFLAVPLREPALRMAQRTLDTLRGRVAAVRWTRPETLHMTVHFFGRLDDAGVTMALDAVRPAAAGTAPFEAVIDRLGAFPDRGAPRVLWLGATQEIASMATLARAVQGALRDAGFEIEARPFRAHCTLGRARSPWPPGSRAAWTAALSHGVDATTFTADRIVLYESVLQHDGAVYHEHAVLPFAG